jgi:hypothetical protein
MCGATLKITHQNPDYLKEAEEAFGITDSSKGGYKEVYMGREANTGRVYIGIKGNSGQAQIAKLDNIAKETLLAFLGDQ